MYNVQKREVRFKVLKAGGGPKLNIDLFVFLFLKPLPTSLGVEGSRVHFAIVVVAEPRGLAVDQVSVLSNLLGTIVTS